MVTTNGINKERWTAEIEGDFVVFLIGARRPLSALRSMRDLGGRRGTNDPHLDAWRNYWRRVGNDDRTGIWHETFLVRAGEYEAVYGNMPPKGLGKASELIPLAESSSARSWIRSALADTS